MIVKKLILIPLIIMLSGSWAAGAPPEHANGEPPDKFYMVDFGGPFEMDPHDFIECDGFGTTITVTIGGFWMTHPANAGKDLWEFYHSDWPVKIANANNPDLFVEGIPGQVMNRHWTGAPFGSDQIETGVQLMVVLPGYGVVYRNVGRIILDTYTDPDNSVIKWTAGQWDATDGDYQALCAALTP